MNNHSIKTIAVMTSGGDAPGMNPCIRAVVRSCAAREIQIYGVYDGFDGLIRGDFWQMGPRDVSGILQRGGTILRTARCDPFRTANGQREAIRSMNSAGIEALVVIGGDGSLNGANALAKQGVPVIGVPASIDNDIFGTDMCIGVDTALNTIVEAVDKLRDTATSHSRAFLVETMGRECGYLAMMAGINVGAETVLIPEMPLPVEEVAKVVEEAYLRGKRHCIIIVAEGYRPRTTDLARRMDDLDLGFITRVTILGHLQRGGKPLAYDRWLSSRFGLKAVDFLLEGQQGCMVGLDGREMKAVPLDEVTSNKRTVSMERYELGLVLAT